MKAGLWEGIRQMSAKQSIENNLDEAIRILQSCDEWNFRPAVKRAIETIERARLTNAMCGTVNAIDRQNRGNQG